MGTEKKGERFEMRLTTQELEALNALTERAGFASRSKWVAKQIQSAAKRKKVWS